MNLNEPMGMLQVAASMFTLAVLSGVKMAITRFVDKRNPPAWIAMLYGLLGTAGVTLLVYAGYMGEVPPSVVIAEWLLLLAVCSGAVLVLAYKSKKTLLPTWLVLIHALLAVSGYTMLFLAAW